MKLIAVTGPTQSGKTTSAQIIEAYINDSTPFPVLNIAVSTPMKEALTALGVAYDRSDLIALYESFIVPRFGEQALALRCVSNIKNHPDFDKSLVVILDCGKPEEFAQIRAMLNFESVTFIDIYRLEALWCDYRKSLVPSAEHKDLVLSIYNDTSLYSLINNVQDALSPIVREWNATYGM